jgi:hypothetical protein
MGMCGLSADKRHVPPLIHYSLGAPWSVEARFAVEEVATDPTTVAATARKPDGTLLLYAYPGPHIEKTADGVFLVSDTASDIGVWYVEVVGTGVAAGRARDSFLVDPRWPADMLGPHALTSIEAVELLIDRVGTQSNRGSEEDDKRMLARLINSFSRLALDFTEREFLPLGLDEETRPVVYDGDGWLSLAPFEANEISAVTLYADRELSSQVALSAGLASGYGWTVERRSPEGTILRIGLAPIGSRAGSWARWYSVAVTATWGAGVVPPDVAYIVESEVANAFWRSRTRSNEADEVSYGPYELSATAQAALEPHANRSPLG